MDQNYSMPDNVCSEISSITDQTIKTDTNQMNLSSAKTNQIYYDVNNISNYRPNTSNANFDYSFYDRNIHFRNNSFYQSYNNDFYNYRMENKPFYSQSENLKMQNYPYFNHPDHNKNFYNQLSYNNVVHSQINQSYYPYQNNYNYLNNSLQTPQSFDFNEPLSRSLNNFSNYPTPNESIKFSNDMNSINQLTELKNFLSEYKQWREVFNIQRMVNNPKERLTPFKFVNRHSKINFGSLNYLIIVSGTCVTIHNIKSTLIESSEETLINTWPGPLIKNETNKSDILEYIKSQERLILTNFSSEFYSLNTEKIQLWQLLSIMVKQNGFISSSELAEFLISNNKTDFENNDAETNISTFRRFLFLGQKKNALEFARKANLWSYRFALAYLISNPSYNEIMINCVNDFIDLSIPKEDPVFTLLNYLLYDLKKKIGHKITCNLLPPSNLKQFTILLANDCEISPVISGATFVSEVLKLIVALRNKQTHFINLKNIENFLVKNIKVSSSNFFNEEILFMNEILEFCQNSNLPLIEIIPYKVIFATKLFDFGLYEQAIKYCDFVKNVFDNLSFYGTEKEKINSINWDLVNYIILNIKNRIEKNSNYPSIESSVQTSPFLNSSPITDLDDYSQKTDLQINQLDTDSEDITSNKSVKLSNQNQDTSTYVKKTLISNPIKDYQIFSTKVIPTLSVDKVNSQNQFQLNVPTQNIVDNFKPINNANNFLVPKTVLNNNFPSFDFVSKPDINVFETKKIDDTKNLIKKNQVTTDFLKQPFNLNSTMALNPSFQSKKFEMSPSLSPIGSPNLILLNKEIKQNLNPNLNTGVNETDNIIKTKLDPIPDHQLNELNLNDNDNDLNDKGKDKKSFFSSFTSKLSNLNWQTKSNQAILPDDSEERFYYDENLKEWIDKFELDKNSDLEKEKIKLGPPKNQIFINQSNNIQLINNQIPPPKITNVLSVANEEAHCINQNQYSFMKNAKKQRYVDITTINK